MCISSGEIPKPSMPPSMCDTCCGCEPSACIFHNCISPLRFDANQISAPSALHTGEVEVDEVSVSSRSSPVAMSWLTITVTPLFSAIL